MKAVILAILVKITGTTTSWAFSFWSLVMSSPMFAIVIAPKLSKSTKVSIGFSMNDS